MRGAGLEPCAYLCPAAGRAQAGLQVLPAAAQPARPQALDPVRARAVRAVAVACWAAGQLGSSSRALVGSWEAGRCGVAAAVRPPPGPHSARLPRACRTASAALIAPHRTTTRHAPPQHVTPHLAHHPPSSARGQLWLDAGAVRAVRDRHKSLFAAGITKVTGDFHAQASALAGPLSDGCSFVSVVHQYGCAARAQCVLPWHGRAGARESGRGDRGPGASSHARV
jgi:hypothetical protein